MRRWGTGLIVPYVYRSQRCPYGCRLQAARKEMKRHRALHRTAYEEVRRQEALTPPISLTKGLDRLLTDPDAQDNWVRGLRSFLHLLALQPNVRRIGRDHVDAEVLLSHKPEAYERLATAIGMEIGPGVGARTILAKVIPRLMVRQISIWANKTPRAARRWLRRYLAPSNTRGAPPHQPPQGN